jgi:hypothetical protein
VPEVTLDNSITSVSAVPNTTKDLPTFVLPLRSALLASIIKSSKPSPLTSPAEETDLLIKSPDSPMITKPPVPDSMADTPIALASSFFPNTTKTLPVS